MRSGTSKTRPLFGAPSFRRQPSRPAVERVYRRGEWTMTWLPTPKAKSLLPWVTLAAVVLWVGFVACMTTVAEPTEPSLERRFAEVVQPFLKNYCLACHGAEKPKAKLDLSGYTSVAAVAKNHR